MSKLQQEGLLQKPEHSTDEGGGKLQIRFAGFGGQGIVLAAKILGEAAAIFEGSNAVMTQNYGPEARGGTCSADVIISAARINYPRVTTPDVLVLMSEEAARVYCKNAAPNAVIIVNEGYVKSIPSGKTLRVFSVPASDVAKKLGNVIMANVVLLGFVAAVTKVVGFEPMRDAVLQSVPRGARKMNLAAFHAGYELGSSNSQNAAPEKEKS